MLCTKCSAPAVPIVAIDIDGVLGQYHEHLLNFLELYFNKEMPRGWHGQGNWEDYLGLPHEKYAEGKLAFRQGGFKRWMPLFEGATEITRDCHDAGAEVWVTTTRPYLRLDSVDPDTRWWLDNNRIYYDHLMYDDEKYNRLAQLVDPKRVCAVLDDLPEQYVKASIEFGNKVPIIMRADHNDRWANQTDDFNAVTDLAEAGFVIERLAIPEWIRHHA